MRLQGGWQGAGLEAKVGSAEMTATAPGLNEGAAQSCLGGGAPLVGAGLTPLGRRTSPRVLVAPRGAGSGAVCCARSLWLCPGVLGWGQGVACPPSSPAQGSSSKAWHCLSFLQNIHHHHHNNINNNIVAVAGLGRGPGVCAGRAAPTRGRGVCWPPPGHGAAGPLAVGGGCRAGRSAAPGS